VTPTIVVAGVHSGAGKTTVATGLMAALSRRGLRVQGFKVGPDYIDPSYHTAVTGRPSRTLDGWMLGLDAVAELYARAAARADVCVVEGVMGLFDGRTGGRGAGSTAEIAALLNAPILLVVDAWAIARSAAAIVHGFRTFDPAIRLEGVIVNRVAGEGHRLAVAPPIEEEAGVTVLGCLGRHEALTLPERYLGLVPVTEGPIAQRYFDDLAGIVAREVDLDRVLALAATSGPIRPEVRTGLFPHAPQPARARIAVARDRAFSFYYADSLELLAAWGAELVEFSPLADRALPPQTDAVYIGGGFPELFAAELAANEPLKAALRREVAAGMPFYGECGGYMYAGSTLTDADGRAHEMAGIFPLHSRMHGSRLTLGYRDVRALHDGPVAARGARLRGHEFHWSVANPIPGGQAAYAIESEADSRGEGAVSGSAWGSYVHLHFAADPRIAPRFVATAARYREARLGTAHVR
jgi:cobyrinic acid a,c-diamide synthase